MPSPLERAAEQYYRRGMLAEPLYPLGECDWCDGTLTIDDDGKFVDDDTTSDCVESPTGFHEWQGQSDTGGFDPFMEMELDRREHLARDERA